MTEQELIDSTLIDPATLEPIEAGQGITDEQATVLMAAATTKELLVQCPCGLTPDNLFVEVMQPGKYARAQGDCCGRWSIEFLLNYEKDGKAGMAKAFAAWNSTPRKL